MSNELAVPSPSGFYEFDGNLTQDEIMARLPPASNADINKALAILFKARVPRADQDPAVTLEVYKKAIKGYPKFALEAAIETFIDSDERWVEQIFVPTTPSLCGEIKRQMWKKIKVKRNMNGPKTTLPKNHFSTRWELALKAKHEKD